MSGRLRGAAALAFGIGIVLFAAGCGGNTTAATDVTDTSATLNAQGHCGGSPNPCYWYWQYGTGGSYQHTTLVQGPCGPNCNGGGLSASVESLSPGTTYQYQFCEKGDSSNTWVCVGPDGRGDTSTSFTTTGGRGTTPHVLVVVEENMDRPLVVGNSSAPYYNSLPQTANWHGISHPSLPNYMSLFSGSPQGTEGSDCSSSSCNFPGVTSLASELAVAGVSYATYAEDMPGQCLRNGDSGNYVEHHNAMLYFPNDPGVSDGSCPDYPTTSNINSYGSSKLIQDLNSGTPPAFVLYIPNLVNDGHDTDPAHIDASLSKLIPAIQQTAWWTQASSPKIVVTWDENSGTSGNQVATAVIGAAPTQSSGDHYGTLRSIEDAYGIGHLGSSGSATPLW